MPRNSFKLAVAFAVALMFLAAVGLPARKLGQFYGHLDALNENLRTGDFDAAKAEMDEVTRLYATSRLWGMQWFADSYLLTDTFLQRAAHAYLTGDYAAVVEALENRVDDPRAASLLGSAKFQVARQRYRSITGETAEDAAERSSVVQEVLDHVAPDFERALRADRTDSFDYKWNYDLATSRDAIDRALGLAGGGGAPRLELTKKVEGSAVRRRKG